MTVYRDTRYCTLVNFVKIIERVNEVYLDNFYERYV